MYKGIPLNLRFCIVSGTISVYNKEAICRHLSDFNIFLNKGSLKNIIFAHLQCFCITLNLSLLNCTELVASLKNMESEKITAFPVGG